MQHLIIKEIERDEINFLGEMLYSALFVPEGQSPFQKQFETNPHS